MGKKREDPPAKRVSYTTSSVGVPTASKHLLQLDKNRRKYPKYPVT